MKASLIGTLLNCIWYDGLCWVLCSCKYFPTMGFRTIRIHEQTTAPTDGY